MNIDVNKDNKKNRKTSEESLHKFRRVQQKLSIDGYLPKNKEDYTEKMEEEVRYSNRITSVLQGMCKEESALLIHRYLNGNGQTYNYIVRNKLVVCERIYLRIKNDIFIY